MEKAYCMMRDTYVEPNITSLTCKKDDIFFIKILKNEFTCQEQTHQIPKSNLNTISILLKYSIQVRFLQFQATWY